MGVGCYSLKRGSLSRSRNQELPLRRAESGNGISTPGARGESREAQGISRFPV